MYEENMQQLVKESRKKVHEANQSKLESDHRLRNAEFEIVRRTDMNRNSENEAIARPRMESLRSSNHERQPEHYEELYDNEKLETVELRHHLAEQEANMKAITPDGITALSGIRDSVISKLENKVMITALRALDMSIEMSELFVANHALKGKLELLPRSSDTCLRVLADAEPGSRTRSSSSIKFPRCSSS